MLYRNKVTGNVIETDSKISGENWEKFKSTKPPKPPAADDAKDDENEVSKQADG
jgi:hypothetical protein